MDASVKIISAAAFLLLAFLLVGGPMVLADWTRKRRERVIARQIALTDALDGQLGALVAPVVTKSLFGPWDVRITMPFLRPAVLARMLSVIDDVFADGEAVPLSAYRIVLTVAENAQRVRSSRGARGQAGRWAHTPVGAA
jgi:hypothetical protein